MNSLSHGQLHKNAVLLFMYFRNLLIYSFLLYQTSSKVASQEEGVKKIIIMLLFAS